MFGGPLGDASPSESCVVYIKRGVVGVRVGKKQVSLRYKRIIEQEISWPLLNKLISLVLMRKYFTEKRY